MYERSITRDHRTAFVILIDQSASMNDTVKYQGQIMTKATAVAEVTDQIINELIERARRHDRVRDYYDVAICGYSEGSAISLITSEGESPFVSIAELEDMYVGVKSRIVDRIAPNGVRTPYSVTTKSWVKPHACGDSPMYEAYLFGHDNIRRWCLDPNNRDSFPPMIINITDGMPSDCDYSDLKNLAAQIKELSTSDGNVFLINIHIASLTSDKSVIFPTPEEVKNMHNTNSRQLSELSSTMPKVFNGLIAELKGSDAQQEFIGMSYNTSIEEIITILNIGTISVKRG